MPRSEELGAFALLPDRVRHLGPWQGLTGGEIDGLKLHYRLQLAEQGFVPRLPAAR